MAQAKDGDTVRVHYTGTLGDGTEFDSSRERDPLQFTLGKEEVIEGFEQAVQGMTVGESKDVTIPAAKAYGPRHDQLVCSLPRDEFPEEMELAVGVELELHGDDDQILPVQITELTETEATLDGNHPLAGKDLTFSLELVDLS